MVAVPQMAATRASSWDNTRCAGAARAARASQTNTTRDDPSRRRGRARAARFPFNARATDSAAVGPVAQLARVCIARQLTGAP